MARTTTRRPGERRPTTTNLAKGRGMSLPAPPSPRRQERVSPDLDGERRPTPAWPWIIGVVLCLAGLGVATYLTIAHYDTGVSLACPDTGVINCAKVTTSSYSKILGIPVAVLGLAFFVFMLPLQTPWAWRSTNRLLRMVRMGSCVVGIGFVLWLVYAELIKIGNICIYCTSVHALTFIIFVTTALGTIATAPAGEGDDDDAVAAQAV
jgi:uncharacterized membrane protein